MNFTKSLLLFILTILFSHSHAQDVSGQWNGLLRVGTIQLRVVINISQKKGSYVSTMDSPDQKVAGLPVDKTSFENMVLKLDVTSLKIQYEGVLKDSVIVGDFKQDGQSIPLLLSRKPIEQVKLKRPQEPELSLPYYSENITFDNVIDKIKLAGTLTLPAKTGNFPTVILISGSGPQNRDEEMVGHKPFLVLADFLTKNGIGVLRFDDRGTAESEGNHTLATSLNFASDVKSAVAYIKKRKDITKQKIGLIGHSEGGMIASMVASNNNDIGFIVSLAGPGISGEKILLLQKELINRARGMSEQDIQRSGEFFRGAYHIVKASDSNSMVKERLSNYINSGFSALPENEKGQLTSTQFASILSGQLTNNWMQFFLKYEPAAALRQVRCPVLALNGETDLQVPADVNLKAIKKALDEAGNKDVLIKKLPGMNHLFQESASGLPSEYGNIEQTISPIALNEVKTWILARVR